MSYIKPLDLLKEERAKYESAIRHSDEALSKGKCTPKLNAQHHKNNNKIIKEYNDAIKQLEK